MVQQLGQPLRIVERRGNGASETIQVFASNRQRRNLLKASPDNKTNEQMLRAFLYVLLVVTCWSLQSPQSTCAAPHHQRHHRHQHHSPSSPFQLPKRWYKNSDDDEEEEHAKLSSPSASSESSFNLLNHLLPSFAFRNTKSGSILHATDTAGAVLSTTGGLTKKSSKKVVTTAHELRHQVLDQGTELHKLQVELDVATTPSFSQLANHSVLQLIAQRYQTGSKPGNRAKDDPHILALSLEGGGMRGAVSAGMAAAISCLGLKDSFDIIYGSSAGSVIGAYMVSGQMSCMDVYVDILPAAKRTFVCVKRIFSALVVNAIDLLLTKSNLPKSGYNASPGMNISFVLDGIMDPEHGLRPLDIKSFQENDQNQPLRVVSSYARNGKLGTRCFGTHDFFPALGQPVVQRADGRRQGLFACLEASMTVPGATGPPVQIIHSENNESHSFFDAFCFEPLPYRSAVEEGATHVLMLCSRPEGFQPKTRQGVYERGVAPLYFHSHVEPEVARFFKQGGQQYIYAEDLLTLEEGKRDTSGLGVQVPPPTILYGVEKDEATARTALERDNWKRAHLLPLKVPVGTPELATLEQEQTVVVEAVRGGFAAAFDLLAPVVGLKTDESLTGSNVAELVFPTNYSTPKEKENDIGLAQSSQPISELGNLPRWAERIGNGQQSLRKIYPSPAEQRNVFGIRSSEQNIPPCKLTYVSEMLRDARSIA